MDYAALIQLALSMAGKMQGDGKDAEARALLEKALARFEEIPLPEQTEVDPAMLGPSEMGGVTADPALKAAQIAALNKMGLIEESGGLTLEDRAALAQIQGDLSRNESAGRAQIANQMDARGMGNSGAALAMSLSNQQNSAQRAGQAGMNTAAQAQRRYLDSIMARGKMAGSMRDQDFGERSKAAQAKDEFARYNNASTQKSQYYNADNPYRKFDAQMKVTGARAGMDKALSGDSSVGAQRDRQFWAGLGQTWADANRDDDDEDKK